ncbi:zinc-binding metallopeptidase family protein [Acetobacter fallax]|uniref:Zinc-ribbon domain-containing protein n=1 Tax=Acetobacter fallax TaxID=1737473 RepID=A0ABX0K5Q2_9PROT|nr:putative zinc-binding metallopeptidase [Acetobacter fallax]NHO31220.1 hypothetical protein [Acetobacter fallax]NHO34777.1 hypothetical protein [Acetobacter fallax]
MKLFVCQGCRQIVFFENTFCGCCSRRLGFASEAIDMLALDAGGDDPAAPASGPATGDWLPVVAESHAPRFFCSNAEYDVCNWLLPEGGEDAFCVACRYNHVIPDLTKDGNLERWRQLEQAKHRLFYSLLRLNLPMKTRAEDPTGGLVFNFPDDPPDGDQSQKIMTGHDEGVITIALREADDAEREKMRVEMGEHYRTLLGHFRHEVGHYYWNILVRNAGNTEACRAVFGDDSLDYGTALQTHYQNGPPAGWTEDYVSAYATTHPWEDFAETWAHYLHIVDTLETAVAYGVAVDPVIVQDDSLTRHFDFDPYGSAAFDQIIQAWLPLTLAVNSLNRSMGQPDLYPFVITPTIASKLHFIHKLVHNLPLS